MEDQIFLIISGSDSILHSKIYVVYSLENEVITENSSYLWSDQQLLVHSTPVTYINFYRYQDSFLVIIATQTGALKLFQFFEAENWKKDPVNEIQIDGPVSVAIFSEINWSVLDLLVASAVGYTLIFRDVVNQVFNRRIVIVNEEATTCMATVDMDFDGELEVVTGSYDNSVRIYKVFEDSYEVLWKIDLMHPIMCMRAIDLNKDGILELIIVSMYGISVYSPSHELAFVKLKAVIDLFCNEEGIKTLK